MSRKLDGYRFQIIKDSRQASWRLGERRTASDGGCSRSGREERERARGSRTDTAPVSHPRAIQQGGTHGITPRPQSFCEVEIPNNRNSYVAVAK